MRPLDDLSIREIRGDTPLGTLDFQARKLVEIAKVARKDPEILVVDETTTALSQQGRTLARAIRLYEKTMPTMPIRY